jgi:chorismate mutase
MQNQFLIVDKRILPDYYEKVLQARAMLDAGSVKEVSEAVRLVGISRSTYYKYKDYIFAPNEDTACKKAVLSMMLRHEKGALSETLNTLSSLGANILTITQSLPINSLANVVISLDATHIAVPLSDVLKRLSEISAASAVKLLAIE